MTRNSAIWTYLTLIFLTALIALAITFLRGDLRPFDPKLTAGLTALTLVAVIKSIGVVVAVNAIVGFILRRPGAVVLWIPLGLAMVVLAHHFLGENLGLMRLERIGWADALLMYLPSVAFFSLVGGLLGTIVRRG